MKRKARNSALRLFNRAVILATRQQHAPLEKPQGRRAGPVPRAELCFFQNLSCMLEYDSRESSVMEG